jgi:hypothetical protein
LHAHHGGGKQGTILLQLGPLSPLFGVRRTSRETRLEISMIRASVPDRCFLHRASQNASSVQRAEPASSGAMCRSPVFDGPPLRKGWIFVETGQRSDRGFLPRASQNCFFSQAGRARIQWRQVPFSLGLRGTPAKQGWKFQLKRSSFLTAVSCPGRLRIVLHLHRHGNDNSVLIFERVQFFKFRNV